jgi:hypothetical protein
MIGAVLIVVKVFTASASASCREKVDNWKGHLRMGLVKREL